MTTTAFPDIEITDDLQELGPAGFLGRTKLHKGGRVWDGEHEQTLKPYEPITLKNPTYGAMIVCFDGASWWYRRSPADDVTGGNERARNKQRGSANERPTLFARSDTIESFTRVQKSRLGSNPVWFAVFVCLALLVAALSFVSYNLFEWSFLHLLLIPAGGVFVFAALVMAFVPKSCIRIVRSDGAFDVDVVDVQVAICLAVSEFDHLPDVLDRTI